MRLASPTLVAWSKFREGNIPLREVGTVLQTLSLFTIHDVWIYTPIVFAFTRSGPGYGFFEDIICKGFAIDGCDRIVLQWLPRIQYNSIADS